MPPEDFFDEDWEEPSHTQETAVTRPSDGTQKARPQAEPGPRPRIPRPSRIPGTGRIGGGRKGGGSGGTGGPGRPRGGGGRYGQLEYGRLAVLGAGILVLLVIAYFLTRGGGASSTPTEKYFSQVSPILTQSDNLGASFRNLLVTSGLTPAAAQKALQEDTNKAKEQYAAAKAIKPTSQLVPVHPYLLQALQYRVNGLRCLSTTVIGATKDKPLPGGQALAACTQKLLASDIIYPDSYASAAHDALSAANITAQVPTSRFLHPSDTKLVTARGFADVLQRLKPGAVHGLHGVQLVGVTESAGGKALSTSQLNTVTYTSKLTFTITIKNGGNFQEVGVPVKLSLLHAGSQTITKTATISTIARGAHATVTIGNLFPPPSQPQYSAPYTLKVFAGPVPGERNTSNNGGTYRVAFKVAA